MKIFILPISPCFQPSAPHAYPAHHDGYGIEQDMLEWLKTNSQYLTFDPSIADWHYLPVFWTNFLVRNDYGKKNLHILQRHVDRVLLDPSRTFTVCQYADGPLINLDPAICVFLASRKKEERGVDIPLLSKAHTLPFWRSKKRYLACFSGRLHTHPLRQQMQQELAGRKDIIIHDGDSGTSAFVKMLLRSYIALCPRGYGGSSFRFYEAMQLGIVPLLVSNSDTRPFKKYIDWDECSIFCEPGAIAQTLSKYSKKQLLKMGKNAKKIFVTHLSFGKWQKLLFQTLEDIKPSKRQYYTESDNISFYIPAYNCEDTLEEAVESIMTTNFCQGDELIIVDDASIDDTPVVIDMLKNKYPQISSFRHSVNQGGGATRNRAIMESSNQLLFNLDADNVLERNSIAPLKSLLVEKQADAAAFGAVRFFLVGTLPDKTTHSWVFKTDENGMFTLEMNLSSLQPPGSSGNYLFTKDSWRKAGGFPCDSSFLDTWGFGIRQLFTGAVLAILPNSYYFHRYGNQSYWVRGSSSGPPVSVHAMQILSRFFNEIEPWDVGYITGRYRNKWFYCKEDRPIRLIKNREKAGLFLLLNNIQVSTIFYCREIIDLSLKIIIKILKFVYRKARGAFRKILCFWR